jgi:hypothetical protein
MKTRQRSHDRSNWPAMIRAEIDQLLTIKFINEDQVYRYSAKLDVMLERINDYARVFPEEALDLVLFFVKEIPRVFENVHDEWELAAFCCELAESAFTLTKVSGRPPQHTVAALVEAYLADADETCHFDDVPEILTKRKFNKMDRLAIAKVLFFYATKANGRELMTLKTLAELFSASVIKRKNHEKSTQEKQSQLF